MTRENPSRLQHKHFFVRLKVTDPSVSELLNEAALSWRADMLVSGGDWSQEQEIMRCQGVDLEGWESSTMGHFCFLFRADLGGRVSLEIQGKME